MKTIHSVSSVDSLPRMKGTLSRKMIDLTLGKPGEDCRHQPRPIRVEPAHGGSGRKHPSSLSGGVLIRPIDCEISGGE